MTILFIDCYDSFTYNLVNLIKKAIPNTNVAVVHNDKISLEELRGLLDQVEAIIVGPGPGHPNNPEDSGIIKDLWSVASDVPVFGVCFGLQSLATTFGGSISRLNDPQHGQFGYITHSSPLFENIPQDYRVVRYHSLHVTVPEKSPLEVIATAEDGCIMGIRHTKLPFYAVQFHPESVLSDFGEELYANFWRIARAHNEGRNIRESTIQGVGIGIEPLLTAKGASQGPHIAQLDESYDPVKLCQHLKNEGREFVLLHSCAWPGNWSIIGLMDESTVHIQCREDSTLIGPLDKQTNVKGDAWAAVADFMQPKLVKSETRLPFIGGLVGYVTYERACNQPGVSNSDMSFVFIENAILIDQNGVVFTVGNVSGLGEADAPISPIGPLHATHVKQDDYVAAIEECKEFLKSGDSYELCLTGQTTVEVDIEPWELFKHIVAKNPAPYCTFFNFDDVLVGSSPERFLSWDSSGNCQFRPIKGTVKKTPDMTRDRASAILNTKKELGENLMIVDLIRHDLGQLIDDVKCPQTMKVEEYKTVFQLVSVIEGNISVSKYSGIDVLRHSLPPGSMTGAPKKRSVEILRRLEKLPRGLYSGISGYWSINDVGDWSVVIRSAFQYKNEPKTWRMGAGGAVTILSENLAEYEEMRAKLDSFYQVFSEKI